MKIHAVIAAAFAVLVSDIAVAQTMVVQQAVGAPVLRAGTRVTLRTTNELTTNGKTLKAGQRINLEVAEPVRVNDQVVIPAASPAYGELTAIRNKGMWGKSGRINGRLSHIEVGGRQIKLTGDLDSRGQTGTAGVVGAIAVLPIAGFFVTGTSATIPAGTMVYGTIGEDVPVAFAAPVPAPVPAVVPTAALQPIAAPR